jgi:hypothetical protein
MYGKYLELRPKINNKTATKAEKSAFEGVGKRLNTLNSNSTGNNKIKHQEVLNDYINNKKVQNLTHPLPIK